MLSRYRWILALLLFATIAVIYGDRVGFEGDDLAIIDSVSYLDLRPLETTYRYPWQPLSFVVAHQLVEAGLPPLALTYVANVFGALGLVLLGEALCRVLARRGNALIAYGLVLAVPELWITILYFNTTALGLPFFSASLLLLHPAMEHRARIVVSAVLFAGACLFRLDFALVSPVILLLVYHNSVERKVTAVTLYVAVAAAVGLAGLYLLNLSVLEVFSVAMHAEEPMWPHWRSLVTLVLSMLPLLLLLPFVLRESWRRKPPSLPLLGWVLSGTAILIAFYPLKALYSGKYLVPTFCLGIYGVAMLLSRPARTADQVTANDTPLLQRANVVGSVLVLILVYVVGLQIDRERRRIGVGFTASTFKTHDGVRPFGGYLSELAITRDPEQRLVFIRLNRNMAKWMMGAPGDSRVVLRDTYDGPGRGWRAPLVNNWSWSWPSLYMRGEGWRVDSYQFKERLAMISPDGRRAEFVVDVPGRAAPPSGTACELTIGPVSFGQEGYEELERFAALAAQSPCSGSE